MSNADANWYNQQIKRVPLLTPAEEITLGNTVQEWLNHPDGPENAPSSLQRRGRRSQKRIIEANLRLVVSVANKYSQQVPSAEFMDLVQAGNIGLLRAVEKFDPTRGYRFSTYAYWWIRQGVSRYIETQARVIRLPSSVMQKVNEAARETRRLIVQLGRTPSKKEVAEAIGISAAELEELLCRGQACLSLDAKARGDDSLSNLGELIADPNGVSKDEALNQIEDELNSRELMEGLNELTDPERFLIEGHFGISQEKQTIGALAKQLKIQSCEASKLLKAAKLKLRRIFLQKLHRPRTGLRPQQFPAVNIEFIHQLELMGWLREEPIEAKLPTNKRSRRAAQGVDCIQSSFW